MGAVSHVSILTPSTIRVPHFVPFKAQVIDINIIEFNAINFSHDTSRLPANRLAGARTRNGNRNTQLVFTRIGKIYPT